jgi:hypothetical protein
MPAANISVVDDNSTLVELLRMRLSPRLKSRSLTCPLSTWDLAKGNAEEVATFPPYGGDMESNHYDLRSAC